jgi:hypothetical protein
MKEIRYVGPHDSVDVQTTDTPYGTVERGKTLTVPDPVADGLLEQGLDHWRPVGGDVLYRTHDEADAAALALGITFEDDTKLADKTAAINAHVEKEG